MPVLLLGPAGLHAAEPSVLSYYGLGIKDGLANNSVYCVIQDSAGLMWFGTFGGLSRWDGENFRNYRPKPGEASLAASVVFALLEDGDAIWIGTDGGGLSRFDRKTETFTTWRASPLDPDKLSSDRVLALGRGLDGEIWAGTGDGLVNIVDRGTGRIRHLSPPGPPTQEPSSRAAIRCLALDPEGSMWVGTEGDGLIEVPRDGRMRVNRANYADASSIASDTVRSLLVDSDGRLWVGQIGRAHV